MQKEITKIGNLSHTGSVGVDKDLLSGRCSALCKSKDTWA